VASAPAARDSRPRHPEHPEPPPRCAWPPSTPSRVTETAGGEGGGEGGGGRAKL
jgi:hypothetical protein